MGADLYQHEAVCLLCESKLRNRVRLGYRMVGSEASTLAEGLNASFREFVE